MFILACNMDISSGVYSKMTCLILIQVIHLILTQVLRLMRGYDEFNTLLLPPREVNDKLPYELIFYYDGKLKDSCVCLFFQMFPAFSNNSRNDYISD